MDKQFKKIDGYLKIHDWEEHQSKRKKGENWYTYPWIKIYSDLLTNPKFIMLTDSQKGQLFSIWLVANRYEGQIPPNAAALSRLAQTEHDIDLEFFINQGFIDRYSQGTAKGQPRDGQMIGLDEDIDKDIDKDIEKELPAAAQKTTRDPSVQTDPLAGLPTAGRDADAPPHLNLNNDWKPDYENDPLWRDKSWERDALIEDAEEKQMIADLWTPETITRMTPTGGDQKRTRNRIGRFIKEWEAKDVLWAFNECSDKAPKDPLAYVAKILQSECRPKKGGIWV